MKIFDCHTHTRHSPDANEPVAAICEAAIAQGLAGVCITDHCEMHTYLQDGYRESIKSSVLETLRAQKKYSGYIRVLTGVEMGQPMQNQKDCEDLFAIHPFDVILCSVHNIQGYEDFYYLDYTRHDGDKLLESYFDEMYRSVLWGKFDILTHITYPLRYMPGYTANWERHREALDAILKALAQQGKALEVNTSGLRQSIGETLPPLWMVKRFVQLGGELITLGSDAHRGKDVAFGFAQGLALIQKAGGRYLAHFEKRKPVLEKIVF